MSPHKSLQCEQCQFVIGENYFGTLLEMYKDSSVTRKAFQHLGKIPKKPQLENDIILYPVCNVVRFSVQQNRNSENTVFHRSGGKKDTFLFAQKYLRSISKCTKLSRSVCFPFFLFCFFFI